jgi:hypothetical protein
MCYTTKYIATAGTRLGIVENVFAVRRELESPFRDVVPIFTRTFLLPKISGSNRFYPDCLKRYIENVNKKQALSPPDNLHHNTWLKQRVMIFFATCEQLRGSRRLIVGTGNISTLNALHEQ